MVSYCRRRSVCQYWVAWAAFLTHLLLISSRAFVVVATANPKTENNGCSSMKLAWVAKGFGSQAVPQSQIAGDHLQVCSRGFTCCTQPMEQKLVTRGQQSASSMVAEKVDILKELFATRFTKFNAFCLDLLTNSSRDLHTMFVRTYGVLYQQNSAVFDELFSNLRRYHRGVDIDLTDVIDSFFANLAARMFTLLNAQYSFDERYVGCVRTTVDDVAPFGDVPQKLGVQMKRAFVAARTIMQGLAVGRDVIAAVSKMELTAPCTNAVTKMLYCPYCRGLVPTKPCSDYCMNVMRGCLAYHTELNDAWNVYLDALLKVGVRLLGPFNIESVIGPINVKISDAIMNFQESGETVTNKVFQACGQPSLSGSGRSKRGASGDEIASSSSGRYSRQLDDSSSQATRSGGIDLLIHDIRDRLTATQDFWKNLPRSVCNVAAAPPSEISKCWNGMSMSRYMPAPVENGLAAQVNNPEVEVDTRKTNSVISQQILQLTAMSSKLKMAHSGLPVDWTDTVDDFEDGSGSGMSSGSGATIIDDDDDDIVSVYQPPVGHDTSFTVPTRPPVLIVTQRGHDNTHVRKTVPPPNDATHMALPHRHLLAGLLAAGALILFLR